MPPGPPASAESLRAGDIIGGFQVDGVLAHGGMSVVYRARQLCLGDRPVALKVLSARSQDAGRRTRFEREARILATLRHERLAEVYGFGEERGLVYYAMRLVKGISLQEFLERIEAARPTLDPHGYQRVVAGWGIDVADALALVHEAGLVHRDVKPANVVLEGVVGPYDDLRNARAALVDFGLVRSIEVSTHTLAAPAATPHYASPEQLLGADVDASTDVFSLGATLHDLIALRLGHERAPACQGLGPLSQAAPGVDRDLEAIIGKAADPQRAWRYADAGALRDDLVAWVDGREVSARSPPLGERVQRWFAARASRIAKFAAVTLAAAGMVGLILVAGGWLRELHALTDDLRAGNLVVADSRIDRLSEWLLRALPGDVRETALRLHAGLTGDPLTAVVQLLQRDELPAALHAAATQVRLLGPGADPVLDRVLLERLDRDSAGDSAATRHRVTALRLVARVLYERFDLDGSEQAARRPYRSRLVTLWDDPALQREERLFVLSGLSGAASSADINWLFAWAAMQPPQSEEQRLGLSTVQRTTNRCLNSGQLEGLHSTSLWDAALPMLNEQFDASPVQPGTPGGLAAQTMGSTMLALAFACRRVGLAIPETVSAAFCSSDDEVECAGRIKASGLWANGRNQQFFTAVGCPSVASAAVISIATASDANSVRTYSQALYMRGDESLLQQARAIVEENAKRPGDEKLARAFDDGVGDAQGQMRGAGAWENMQLDEPTRLGYAWPTDADKSLDESRESDEEPDSSGAIASWDFTTSISRFGGSATEARLHHGVHSEPQEARRPDWFLLLRDFGGSSARLSFVVDRPPRTAILELMHISAERPFYPYCGECQLSIELDGKTVAESITVITRLESHRESIPLPASLLGPGEHTITISLRNSTTTTYRLWSARVRDADSGG